MEAQLHNWTLEECKEIALRYKTRSQWQKNDYKSYKAATKRKDWLEQCCGHMEEKRHNWTLEECKKIALRYNTKSEWAKNDKNSYQAARNNDWLEQCCGHMEKRQA
jgi:nuclear transport factor 2 (NTF2) superfamily protein